MERERGGSSSKQMAETDIPLDQELSAAALAIVASAARAALHITPGCRLRSSLRSSLRPTLGPSRRLPKAGKRRAGPAGSATRER
jgi:hypothetical protein